MIHVENLCKSFYSNKKYEGFGGAIKSLFSNEKIVKKAIDEINFDIAEGEIAGYIGLNGAGKSTTIKIMTGLMTPTSGKCIINGLEPYKNRKIHTKNIGVVFGQRTQLWWDLPVSESFGILKKIYDIPDNRYKQTLSDLKELLGLDEFYLTPVRNLSLGQKMRADLAAALLHEPKIIFLDEPTIGLDVIVKAKIRESIKQINKLKNTTVLLTTHDLDDIEQLCNKIIVIDKGKIIYNGSLEEIKEKYAIYRKVVFQIKEQKNINFNEIFKLNCQDLTFIENEHNLEIKFNKEAIQAPELVNFVMNNYAVSDITIQEPQMEDIVREIYSH